MSSRSAKTRRPHDVRKKKGKRKGKGKVHSGNIFEKYENLTRQVTKLEKQLAELNLERGIVRR